MAASAQAKLPTLFLPKTMTGNASVRGMRTSADQTPFGVRKSKKAKPKGKPGRVIRAR
jgi:hypothetical protein